MKIALVIIIFGGAVVALVISYFRRREMAFTGVVTDKDVREQVNNNAGNANRPSGISFGTGGYSNGTVTHEYIIKVQTDTGKLIHYNISEGKYEIVQIGDRVSKPSGTTDITIEAKSPTTPAAPQPPTPPAGTVISS